MAVILLILFSFSSFDSIAQEVDMSNSVDSTISVAIKKIEEERFANQKKLMELKLENEKKKLLEKKEDKL